MLKTKLWFVVAVLTSMACAGPRAVQPTGEVSYPAPETVQPSPESVDGPVLSLDQISLADSLQYAKDPLQTLQITRNYYDIALSSAQAQDFTAAQTAIDEALRRLISLSDLRQTWVITGRQELLRDLSRLVVRVHEGGSLIVPERRGEITRDTNSQVTKQIDWWRRYSPGALKLSYARSGLYHDIIQSEIEKRGMPQELQWLPAVESNFKPRAYSWADAAGLWQFIMGTGSRYGLSRTEYVDDRMDPFKATGAALDYLNDLYDMFGDWHLALAAYNCGENRVLRAINRQGTSDFWQLRLPKETRRYVPRFLAAVYLFENPELYDIELPDREPPY
ncbi:MAG: lytic transglycosylase domain-containing protein, partial [Candidatus Latescibacteria bacterium]|nr:lytic transglycosylase domain-containing protein [Candidatus Latescibacterota bacterium]